MKLNIWDTAGQERYDALTKLYFKDAEAALVVYDITDELSFEKAQKWVRELEEHTHDANRPSVVTFIVGNKCELTDQKAVSFKAA